MAKDVADLVAKFREAADKLPPTTHDKIVQGAQRTKAIYLAGAQRAGLTPGKRMNVGKRGARWGVRYELLSSRGGNESAIVRYTGPVHLVNNDTRAHPILAAAGRNARREEARQVISALTGTRVRRSRRTGGPKALALPTGPVASVKHPGTRGKDFFTPADDFARREVTRITGGVHREYLTRAGFGRN